MDVVTIYNMALGKVGTRTTVSATTEGSNEANSCNTFYASTRDALLRAVQWNFCRKQVLLTQLRSSVSLTNPPPAPWAYEYAYPSDCLKARYILPQVAATQIGGIPIDSTAGVAAPKSIIGPPVNFIIGLDTDTSGNNVRVILTDQFQAQLVYTLAITDPNLFDSEFIELLATILAARVARNLTADRGIVKDLLMEAKELYAEAASDNGNEGLEVINPMPDWIRTRGVASDTVPMGYDDFDSLFQIQ